MWQEFKRFVMRVNFRVSIIIAHGGEDNAGR